MNSLIKCKWETDLEQVVSNLGQDRHSKVYELDRLNLPKVDFPFLPYTAHRISITCCWKLWKRGFLRHLFALKVKKKKRKADDIPDDKHLCRLIFYAVAFIFFVKNLFFLLSCNIIVRNCTHIKKKKKMFLWAMELISTELTYRETGLTEKKKRLKQFW